MPSASDYTSFLKYNVAATSYRNGAIPKNNQNTMQIAPLVSIINAQTLASSVGATIYGATSVVTATKGRVLPYAPGTTNNPNALSTLSWGGTRSSSQYVKR